MTQRSTDSTIGRFWCFVAACALTVSVVHVAHNEISLRVFNRFTWTTRDFVWMAPIAYLTLTSLLGVILTPFKRARETLTGAFATWSLLLLWTTIHPLATLALSLGVGRALAWLSRGASSRQLRWTTAGSLALIGIGVLVTRARASSPTAAAATEAPNVVLLILDTVGAKRMSLYGYHRETTPRLQELARESIVFDNAFAASTWSLPSHAAIFTGLLPHEQGTSYVQPMRDDARSIVEVLRARGYATGGFTANVGYAGHQTGLARGFDHFEDFPRSVATAFLTTTFSQMDAVRLARLNMRDGYLWGAVFAFKPRNLRLVGVRRAPNRPAADILQRFQGWRRTVEGRPFFAFINFMEAHSPYRPPEPFRSRYDTSSSDRYDGAIAYLDSVVHALLQTLPPNTIVAITADHGEQWGEKGFTGHGNTLYLPALRVPLIVRLPQRTSLRVPQPVSLRDLPATILDLSDIPHSDFPGASLRDTWERGKSIVVYAEATQGKNVPPTAQNFSGPLRSVLDSAGHYIRLGNGKEEFYTWPDDLDELNNLAGKPEYAPRVRQYRKMLDSFFPSFTPQPSR